MITSALGFSKLFYCSSVWASIYKNNFAKLQKVQNFAVRTITGTRKYKHITPALQDLEWLLVKRMFKYMDAIMTFNCFKGSAPSYLSYKFKRRSDVHSVETINSNNLNIPVHSFL